MRKIKIPETVGQNAGLALSRYVPWPKDDKKRPGFFAAVTQISADEGYKAAYRRWEAAIRGRKALLVTATLGGPLAVGLGNESPTEVGLTLHRVYGMPLIPGSAIKGACLRAVRRMEIEEKARPLFGDTDEMGYAVFHDAWYVPDSVGGTPLAVDTVTVHHPDYYQQGGKVFPTDFDDPNPVPFISVKTGAQFRFGLEIAASDDVAAGWRDFAETMLRYTLTEIGIGGKTNAGYGWFKEVVCEHPVTPEMLLKPIQERIGSIRAAQNTGMVNSIIAEIEKVDDISVQRAALLELRRHLQEKRFWKPDKTMYQNIDRKIEEVGQ
jgi:CRISPR type III-B/RAMP module RAMP protein Cmr6